MTREQIEHKFQLFGTIIPASTADAERRRTAYFYRCQAIAWARMARRPWPLGVDMQPLCQRLAKNYLASYRQMKSTK